MEHTITSGWTVGERQAQARRGDKKVSRPISASKRQALDDFLASVERRAYAMAKVAVGDREEALDIVQDAMMKLVQLYAHKEVEDWGPLFHRIMQSRIRDWYRRSKVKNRLFGWLGSGRQEDDFYGDPLEQVPGHHASDPAVKMDLEHAGQDIVNALQNLSLRQQQAFMLRIWEGLDVRETAFAMGCSEGSVKTHLSRAISALREQLQDWSDDHEA